MRRSTSGFTLIELLIVVGIIGLLAAVLVPQITESRYEFTRKADSGHLSKLGNLMVIYKQRLKHLPNEGGHKLLLSLWTSGVMERKEENFGLFFTPESDSPGFQDLMLRVKKGENVWPDLSACSSTDTDYAARAKQHLAKLRSDDALAATDNEGGWCLQDGSVNILLGDLITVREYSYQQLVEVFEGVPAEFNKEEAVVMVGDSSPIPICRKLDY